MALFHANFFSETLGMQSSADVILPEKPRPGKPLPVLFLLHGLSDDHTIWQRRTSIERYALPCNLAVVMPNGHRSFYTDQASGGRYFSYIADELPALMRSFFPISERHEDNFIAGLSMGGYGAFKAALNRPKQYAAARAAPCSFRPAAPRTSCTRTTSRSGTPRWPPGSPSPIPKAPAPTNGDTGMRASRKSWRGCPWKRPNVGRAHNPIEPQSSRCAGV